MGAITGIVWVRVLIGAVWLLAGLEKLLNPEFPSLFEVVLKTEGFVKDAPPWFQEFMETYVLPNPIPFATLVGAGETAVGVALLLGFLTNLGALGGIFMNLGLLTSLGGLAIGSGLGASGILPLHMILALTALIVLLSPGAKAASVAGPLANRSPRLAIVLLSAGNHGGESNIEGGAAP